VSARAAAARARKIFFYPVTCVHERSAGARARRGARPGAARRKPLRLLVVVQAVAFCGRLQASTTAVERPTEVDACDVLSASATRFMCVALRLPVCVVRCATQTRVLTACGFSACVVPAMLLEGFSFIWVTLSLSNESSRGSS